MSKKEIEFKGPFEPIIPDAMDWPISRFYRDRKRVVWELERLNFNTLKEKYGDRLPDVIKQTIYSERIRSKRTPWKVDPPNEVVYWEGLEKEFKNINPEDDTAKDKYDALCRKILRRYSEEIPGDFNPKTFAFARKFLTKMFGAIYNPWYKKQQNGIWWGKRKEVLNKFKVTGPIEKIKGLFDRTSVVVVPTHFSNLDSPLIGYGIETMTGMPAFSYGAGLNLYDYELAAYYMSRLGAYKIDRRKRNALYLNTLKEFSVLSFLKGLNTVFFPGGTRSRSGELESSVKYGLLGTLIDAQNYNFSQGLETKIMVVPLVVSYHFVFEAEDLITQHLRKVGKSKYTSRRSSKAGFMHLIRRFFNADSEVYMAFGQPMDVFGNELDEHANSISNGEIIDIKKHFTSDGVITMDKQRNDVYTRILGDKIVKSYHKENIVLSSHLICFVAFELFQNMYSDLDVFGFLNIPVDNISVSIEQFYSAMDKVLDALKIKSENGKIQLSPVLHKSNSEIVEYGLKHVNSFHYAKVLKVKDDILSTENLKLLFYYHNRLNGYELESLIAKRRIMVANSED